MSKGVQTVFGVLGAIAGFLVMRSGELSTEVKLAILIGIAIAAIGYPIGWFVGRYLVKDSDVDSGGFVAIACIGVLGFLIPVVGMAMSAVVWQFYKESERHRALYAVLSSVVGLLSVGNAAFGAAMGASDLP